MENKSLYRNRIFIFNHMQIRATTIFHLLKIVICFIIFCFPVNIHAQNIKKIDSLKLIVSNTHSNADKLSALVILNSLNQNRDELVAGFKQQLTLAKSLKAYPEACAAYSNLGYFEYENSNFKAAENIVNEGMDLARQTNDYFSMGKFSNRLMMISDKKGDMANAMKYLKQGEQLLSRVNKWVNLTRLYCNASEIFMSHQLNENALLYARKAYAAARSSGELEPMTTSSFYLASRLQNIGKYDSAIYYFSSALQVAKKLNLLYTQADALKGLSDVYAEIKQYHTAREYLKSAVTLYDSVNVTDRKIVCEESFAFLDFMDKDFSAVKKYILKRISNPTQDTVINNLYINKWLANLALVDKDVENWKKYYSKYEQANAFLVNDKIQENILVLEAKYDLSKKETELRQIDTENRKRLWIITALVLGLFSIMILVIAQYRNHKSNREIAIQKSIIEKQHALAEERLRIAADMHDDVGAGLSRIRYITASMKEKKYMPDDDIEKIISLSDESVEKMNEIIWALNQGNQQLDEFIYYTRSQCSEMLNNAGLSFSFELPENIPHKILAWKDCRNIYLLVKEAVNNALKHAGAKRITIECSVATQLVFSIADDGIGFDSAVTGKIGNGLLNYKKRIEKLNGTYQLITAPGEGTKIIFCIPINVVL